MTEEYITRTLLGWLTKRSWKVVAFDYPQSGTGVSLQASNIESTKNKGCLIPDIVACTDSTVAFFENKVRFSLEDVDALIELKVSGRYEAAICRLLGPVSDGKPRRFGIALSDTLSNRRKMADHAMSLDFGMCVDSSGSVSQAFGAPL